MYGVLERHGAHSDLGLGSVLHGGAFGLEDVTRGGWWEFLYRWLLLLKVVVVRAFDLGRASYLPEVLLLLANVVDHGFMTVFFLLFLTVLLLFLFETSHVPGLRTLRDYLRGRSLSDHLDLGHHLNIHLLIHNVPLVEHVLWRRHGVIGRYPWRLLLVGNNFLLLLWWR